MRAGIDGNDNRQRLRREVSRGYVHNDLCKEVKQRGVVYLHASAYVSTRQHTSAYLQGSQAARGRLPVIYKLKAQYASSFVVP